MHMKVKGEKGKKGLYDENYSLIFLLFLFWVRKLLFKIIQSFEWVTKCTTVAVVLIRYTNCY